MPFRYMRERRLGKVSYCGIVITRWLDAYASAVRYIASHRLDAILEQSDERG